MLSKVTTLAFVAFYICKSCFPSNIHWFYESVTETCARHQAALYRTFSSYNDSLKALSWHSTHMSPLQIFWALCTFFVLSERQINRQRDKLVKPLLQFLSSLKTACCLFRCSFVWISCNQCCSSSHQNVRACVWCLQSKCFSAISNFHF